MKAACHKTPDRLVGNESAGAVTDKHGVRPAERRDRRQESLHSHAQVTHRYLSDALLPTRKLHREEVDARRDVSYPWLERGGATACAREADHPPLSSACPCKSNTPVTR